MFDNTTRHFKAWLTAWRHRKLMNPKHYSREALEFLPAALEVHQTPPSPLGRLIAWTIMLFLVIAVLWACYGKVDIVAVSHGKIIPAGKSKVIQPLEIGKVITVHVEEGQAVEQGELLLELDSTTLQADKDRVYTELLSTQAGLARIHALLKALDSEPSDPDIIFDAPNTMAQAILNTQKKLLNNQYAEHRARHAALKNEITRKQAEHAAIEENIKKLEDILPIVTQRAESHRKLSIEHLVAKNEYLTLEQDRIEKVQDLAALKNRATETKLAIQQAKSQRQSLLAEFRKQLYAEQAELEIRCAALEKELIKAKTRTGLQQISSPVDGVVQQLAVHTVGAVVTPAQPLMVIVPDNRQLEIEAWIQNKDIGFVSEGQRAEIKIEAFPFTKYGTIDGEILNISNDAVENEQFGWVFTSRVSMKNSTIMVGDKRINLMPGMSISLEVKTGKRRIIEFFLSPLLRYVNESVKER